MIFRVSVFPNHVPFSVSFQSDDIIYMGLTVDLHEPELSSFQL